MLNANWNYPTNIRVGAGRISELAATCKGLGMASPLLVTDPALAALPMVEQALQQCRQAGLAAGLFSDIQGNPTGENISQGTDAFRKGGHDGVIALGGGSALDAGKAIALMAGQQRPLFDFVDEGDNWKRVDTSGMAPLVAVPTTAGTGSEVGRASVITNTSAQLKMIIFHPQMLPAQVILDPELTVGLPAQITAATGMDALSHNLEALCANYFHPMAEGIALEGMRLVKDYLPRACADGTDIEARTQMLVASSMGATAFQRGLGAMHALAHPLGALYNAHHGLLNAILMPYVLVANRTAIGGTLERACLYLGLENPSYNSFLAWVLELRSSIGIPDSLSAIGIDDEEAERVGEMAAADPSAGGNPIAFTAEEYSQLFTRAVNGVYLAD
jgi:alcohol dehydrogenase class IV